VLPFAVKGVSFVWSALTNTIDTLVK
jgi:hypothetical protein